MKITVLGCGASLGTPAPGGYWGKCDPANEKNHRTRASILVQTDTTNIVVDTTYDLRNHLNKYKLQKIDGVIVTHAHNDHVNGIDDLRSVSYHNNKLLDLYANRPTLEEIHRRWPFLFEPKYEGIYTQFLQKHEINDYDKFRIGDIDIESFEQDHTTCISLGLRFGKFAYSVDVADMPERSLEALKGIETWIVDAAAYDKESVLTHANIQRVKKWADIIKPKMTYLTVLTTHMDYDKLCAELPPHIRPAWDGMEIVMGTNHR